MQRRDTRDHSWGHPALIHSFWLGSSLRLCALTAGSWCCRGWSAPLPLDAMSVNGPTQWGMLCLWMDPPSGECSEMRSSCNFYPGQLLFTTFNLLVTQSPNTYFFSQLDWNNNSPNIMPLNGQPKLSPFHSQRETIQIPISIRLWLQVTAFWGKVLPSLSLPRLWSAILKPVEQGAELAAASASGIRGAGDETKREAETCKCTHAHEETLWVNAAELLDFRPWSIPGI